MSPEINPELRSSPYFAGIFDKSGEEAHALELRIDQLPDALREMLFSEETDKKLRAAMQEANIPDTYTMALAKLIFFVILGEVPVTGIEDVLKKIGLEADAAHALLVGLNNLLAPITAARATTVVPSAMPKVPPLTVQRPAPMGPSDAARNIIDLRKPPEAI